jgi:serine/threonine-protein kinase
MKTFSKTALFAAVAVCGMAAPLSAFAGDLYGAIAYSQSTKAYGWATDYASQEEAEAGAMSACKDRASDCKSAIWFRNACGALSVGSDGGWGADWGADEQAARNKATHVCDGYSYDCQVVIAKCDTGY